MREKRKLFSWVSVVIIIILCIPVLRTNLFSGEEFRPITFSPKEKMENKFGKDQVILGFQDESIQIYYVKKEKQVIPYVYSLHSGIWVEDATETRKRVVSYVKDKAYYYGKEFDADLLKMKTGGTVVQESQTQIGENLFPVYVIKQYQQKL